MPRTRKQYPEDFRTKFGASVMSLSQVVAFGFANGYLMLYMTDYAGLFAGVPGQAALAATTMLAIGRVWDAVNDPIMGFVMDRAPRTRLGRFKPFLLGAIPVSALLAILLFNAPAGLSDPSKLVWIYVCYFLFDTALTAMPFVPLYQSVTTDQKLRATLLSLPRIFSLVLSMLMSGFLALAIALGPDGVTPNIGLATIAVMIPVAAVSLLGAALFKEGHASADEPQVTLKAFLQTVRTNKPLWVSQLSVFAGGFVWVFIFAASTYYVKYAMGVENFGMTSAISGLSSILALLLGVFVAKIVLRWLTPGQTIVVSSLVAAVPLAVLFFLNLAGPITNMALLFGGLFVALLAVGTINVPASMVLMECMDYNKARVGQSMEGSLNSLNQFVQKLQGALAAIATGAVLVAIGYDAALYANATVIPPELFSGLGVVMLGIPALLSVVSGLIMLKYPLLTHQQRRAELGAVLARESQLNAAPVDTH